MLLRNLLRFPVQIITGYTSRYAGGVPFHSAKMFKSVWKRRFTAHSLMPSSPPFPCTTARSLTSCTRQRCMPLSPVLRQTLRSISFGNTVLSRLIVSVSASVCPGKDVELSAVETELDRVTQGKEQEAGVKEQQLSLFKLLARDMSEPSIDLVAKLNCQTKCATW